MEELKFIRTLYMVQTALITLGETTAIDDHSSTLHRCPWSHETLLDVIRWLAMSGQLLARWRKVNNRDQQHWSLTVESPLQP